MIRQTILLLLVGCSNGDTAAMTDGGSNSEASDEAGGACSPSDPGACVRSNGCAGTRTCVDGMWTACTCPEPDLRYKLVEPGSYAGVVKQVAFNSVASTVQDLATMGFVVTSIVHNSSGYTLFGMKSGGSQLKYETKTVEVTGATVDTYGMMLQADSYIITAAALSNSGIHLLVGTRIVGDTFKYQSQIVTTPYYAIDSELTTLASQGYVPTACIIPGTDYYIFAAKVTSSTRTWDEKMSANNVGDTQLDLSTMAGQGYVPTSYCIRENDAMPGPYVLTYVRDPKVSSVPSKYAEGDGTQLDSMTSSLTMGGYFVNLGFGFYNPYQLMGTKQ